MAENRTKRQDILSVRTSAETKENLDRLRALYERKLGISITLAQALEMGLKQLITVLRTELGEDG